MHTSVHIVFNYWHGIMDLYKQVLSECKTWILDGTLVAQVVQKKTFRGKTVPLVSALKSKK